MAAAATAAPAAPFVVGRPAPDPPRPYPVADLRHPGLGRRAKTTLGVGTTASHVVSSATPAGIWFLCLYYKYAPFCSVWSSFVHVSCLL